MSNKVGGKWICITCNRVVRVTRLTHEQTKIHKRGVPLPMGRATARAVKRAMGYEMEASA